MIPFDQEAVLDLLFESEVRLTAKQYIHKIADHQSVSPRDAAKIVKTLIQAQELSYVDLYGSTYIEKSFLRPVRITPNFLVKPPGFSSDANALQINILPGISFGSGQHPTTRLCLKALDVCIFEQKRFSLPCDGLCADIGTGSGILAVAMILSGFLKCRAYEIDRVSVNEAKKNVHANHLSDRIQVIDDCFVSIPAAISLICANLRYPTLAGLSSIIRDSLKPGAVAVLSGFREWEKEDLFAVYRKTGMELIWEETQNQWSAAAFLKR